MAQESKILETVLKEILGETNLPSQYEDFQALTRDLVRKISAKFVLVDRKRWAELTKAKTPQLNDLAAVTAEYKRQNDAREARLNQRNSVVPPRK